MDEEQDLTDLGQVSSRELELLNWAQGDWQESAATSWFIWQTPMGQVLKRPSSGLIDVVRALQAANQTLSRLNKDSAELGSSAQRSRVMRETARILEEKGGEIALCLASLEGIPIKTFREAILPEAVRLLRDAADLLTHPTIDSSKTTLHSGGVAVLLPPNYGAFFEIVMHAAAAISAGTCLIVMAPVAAPASAQAFFQVWAEASQRTGHPPSLLQLLHGPTQDLGQSLLEHPALRLISAIGQQPLVRRLIESSAELRKEIHWSTGCRNPAIWVASPRWQTDSLLQKQARKAMRLSLDLHLAPSIRPSRYFIQDAMAKELLEALVEATESIQVGDPRHPDTEIGPLLRESDLIQHRAAIEQAQKEDGRIVALRPGWDGSATSAPLAVIRDLTLCSTLQQDEIFGPFVNTATYRFLFEGIGKYANASVGHQAAYLLDPETERALSSAERLQFARVFLSLEPRFSIGQTWHLSKGSGAGEQGYMGLVRFLSKVSVLGDIAAPLA